MRPVVVLIFVLIAGIGYTEGRAPFRLEPAKEWNTNNSAQSIVWLTTRAYPFRIESVAGFSDWLEALLKKVGGVNYEVLTAVVSYGDFARYYWLINPKLTRVGGSDGYTRLSSSMVEAIYGFSPDGKEVVYFRNDLLDQDASAASAFKLSRDFPGISLYFKRSDGGIEVFLPGDLYNSSKEGREKRFKDVLQETP